MFKETYMRIAGFCRFLEGNGVNVWNSPTCPWPRHIRDSPEYQKYEDLPQGDHRKPEAPCTALHPIRVF